MVVECAGGIVVKDMSTVAWVESPLQLIGAAEWADAAGERVPDRRPPHRPDVRDRRRAPRARCAVRRPRALPRHPVEAARRSTGTGSSATDSRASSGSPRRCCGRSGSPSSTTARTPSRSPTRCSGAATTRVPASPSAGSPRWSRRSRWTSSTVAVSRAASRSSPPSTSALTASIGCGTSASALTRAPLRVDAARPRPRPHARRPAACCWAARSPVDGRLDLDVYLEWVAAEAAIAPVTYLPHRRETRGAAPRGRGDPGRAARRDRTCRRSSCSPERTEPLEVLTLASSTTTTLPLVLEGSGSVLRARDPRARHRRKAVR